MQAEDDSDVKAANLASAEQVAEMAEFDENFSSQISLSSKEVAPCSLHMCVYQFTTYIEVCGSVPTPVACFLPSKTHLSQKWYTRK